MTKYDALKQYLIEDNKGFDDQYSVKHGIEDFEIAWESGQFNEEIIGVCCK